ncbi:ATP-binding protein [Pedobacter aquatilis]|uniref:ATP-binding protein n=1 Tax=Pedobacter aquatilis TaxID=351343 RepID=UPI00292DA046|nr:ATP-binding protein [Pedobacter aquatilis]
MRLTIWIAVLIMLALGCKKKSHVIPDNRTITDSLVSNTSALWRSGEIEKGFLHMDSAFRSIPSPGYGDYWMKYKLLADFYLNYRLDTTKARQYTDSMYRVIADKKLVYKDFYAQTYFTEGNLLFQEHRYYSAFERLYSGLEFARQHLDQCSQAQFTNQLGLVKYRQGKYQEAIPYLKKALNENTFCTKQDIYSVHSILNTIALCYEHTEKPDSAINYYHKALVLIRKDAGKRIGDAARGVVYGNLGGLFARQGKYQLAEHYLTQSISINNRPGYEMQDVLTAELKLADLYLEIKKYQAADSLLNLAARGIDKQQSQGVNLTEIYSRWLKVKWKYLDKIGKESAAYMVLKRIDKIQDSLSIVNRDLQAADMEIAFRENRQQQRLDLLAHDNELKSIKLRMSIVVVVLLLAIICVVIVSLWRYRKQNKKLIQAMEELAESQRLLKEKTYFLEGLLKNLPIILYQIDDNGKITTSVGAGLSAVPGWSNDQLIGKNAYSLAGDMKEVFNLARNGRTGRAVNAFSVEDKQFYFDTMVLPDNTSKGGIIGFAVDITELIKTGEELKKLNLFKDRLLSVISHDLRQPLSAIMMVSQIINMPGGMLPEGKLNEIVVQLRDTARNAIGILEGVLIWAQSENNNFDYRPQNINLYQNFVMANGIYIINQEQKRIKIENRVPENLNIQAHEQMLLFINRNLISNATKYSPENGVISINAIQTETEIIVSVSDQGRGMTESQKENLFRIKHSNAEYIKSLSGAGFALNICFDMIMQMNGRIWLESEPGSGSIFYYALPVIALD